MFELSRFLSNLLYMPASVKLVHMDISLVREYVKAQFVAVGMYVGICVHDTGGGNPHAHLMLTMLQATG